MLNDTPVDRKVRRLLLAAQRATEHKKPGSWIVTDDVADSLGLNQVDDAVRFAAAHGWVEVDGGHCVRLTEAGRQVVI